MQVARKITSSREEILVRLCTMEIFEEEDPKGGGESSSEGVKKRKEVLPATPMTVPLGSTPSPQLDQFWTLTNGLETDLSELQTKLFGNQEGEEVFFDVTESAKQEGGGCGNRTPDSSSTTIPSSSSSICCPSGEATAVSSIASPSLFSKSDLSARVSTVTTVVFSFKVSLVKELSSLSTDVSDDTTE